MDKADNDSSELEDSDQMNPPEINPQVQPFIYQPNQNEDLPDGMVSVRFACITAEKNCCCCQEDTLYLHQHQVALPENTTVDQFLTLASRMVGSEEKYTICKVNGKFRLRLNDPIGPTIKSYQYFESPILGLAIPAKKSCCLLI